MKHTELRWFLYRANKEKLSPAEKDCFQYYYSRAHSKGFWHCPDDKTAKELHISRSRVNEARRGLKEKGWITFDEKNKYSIQITANFDGNAKEEKFVENSIGFVENPTGDVENPTISVENPTSPPTPPYKDIKREIKQKEKRRSLALAMSVRARDLQFTQPNAVFPAEESAFIREILGDDPEDFPDYAAEALKQIKTVLGDEAFISKRDQSRWEEALLYAWVHRFRIAVVVETYKLLRMQPWRQFRVTPQNVVENLPDFERLQRNLR